MYEAIVRFPSPPNRCRLIAGTEAVRRIGEPLSETDFSSAFVITDANVHRHHKNRLHRIVRSSQLSADILVIPAGERSKSYRQQMRIHDWLLRNGADRHSILIGIGGGVVCDIVGFAAATFMRGIRHILVPTSLMAQIDASIGGKNGINLPHTKNVVGTIKQPVSIIIDPLFLETLQPRHIKEGMSELIKMALIRSKKLGRMIAEYQSIHKGNATDYLAEIVIQGVKLKLEIVRKDPHELGLRKILNFGHTTAHALEVLGKYGRMTHGKAVAFGMLVALEMSKRICSLDQKTIDEAATMISRLYRSFPVSRFSVDDAWEVITRDKKRIGRQVQFVLLESTAKPVVRGVSKTEFKRAYSGVKERWGYKA